MRRSGQSHSSFSIISRRRAYPRAGFCLLLLLWTLLPWRGNAAESPPLFVGHGLGGLLKYSSNQERKYIDTWVHLEVESRKGQFSLAMRVEIETLTWERIGTPIFWLREARYALVPEARLHRGGSLFTFHLFHECYHQIDNVIPGTENFNILRLGWAREGYHPGYDYHLEGESLSWPDRLGWYLFVGSYPKSAFRLRLQTGADFEYDFGGRVRFDLLKRGKGTGWVELNSLVIGHPHSSFYHRHQGRVGISLGDRTGMMDLFTGYNFYDTTPLRPTQGLANFGLGFRF